jgi:hypothetical protein
MSSLEFTRRDLIKAVGAIAGGAALPKEADAQTRRNSAERPRELEEDGLYLSIKSFEKLPGNVLVLCANNHEFRGVMETIHGRDRMRSQRGKFAFQDIQRGVCAEVSGDIRNYTNGADTGTFNNRTMHVLNSESDSFSKEYLNRIKSSHARGFSMVQLRGHTGDMHHLFDMSKEYQAQACFLSMGGCESTQFIKEFHKPERPISAETQIGETANNTQLLIRFFDELGSGKHASWHDFYNSIAVTSNNVGSGRVVVPGDPNYRSFL